ncbi:unnamed protein product [Didymodactylos carnosus]|uniref:Uncharacterized protein n=1 Tax=Didymodactylos carnosus TaxID=1234261 RepID=A0A814MTF1_9BILA|nr:unnamed protein product [Didymodactylos carnosus]CAF1083698.1 unnamed protein product [Didymodactylos carnosus]CAF3659312.1 unnamed protein product [Didymodactylos carnosus]CAF3849360.1 unnamed protein product [Didymodactylos carnosus]
MSNCTAVLCTNPIDVVKVRMQLQHELRGTIQYHGLLRGAIKIVQNEGLLTLWSGVEPALWREASYSTIRMGAYEPIKELLHAEGYVPLWKKIMAGAISGGVGACLTSPTDLIKIRLQAQRGQKNYIYSSTISAFRHIYREEGLRGLYRGVGPTTQRAIIVTASQIASYDETKHLLLSYTKEGVLIHFLAAMSAGFVAAVTTSPIDLIKSRIMNAPSGRYRSVIDCGRQVLRAEGLRGFYTGFVPVWLRIGPHTMVTFLVFEQLRRLAGMKPI